MRKGPGYSLCTVIHTVDTMFGIILQGSHTSTRRDMKLIHSQIYTNLEHVTKDWSHFDDLEWNHDTLKFKSCSSSFRTL